MAQTGGTRPEQPGLEGCQAMFELINRPGVAGAVLQTPPSLIH